MTSIKFPICTIVLSISLSCVLGKVQAQNAGESRLISISLQVIAKGTINESNHDIPGYFVIATITNQQDTAIKFFIMSCSWASENWITSNDSIYFREPGCDINLPADIHLRPHQSIHFYGVLTRSGTKPFSKKVKLGFRYFTNAADLWSSLSERKKVEKPTIYWSNEVEVKDNLFEYQID
jgi:hypothetical protein